MKHRNYLLFILLCILTLTLIALPIFGEDAPDTLPPLSDGASADGLSGVRLEPPAAIRAGEEVVFTLICNGESIRALQGEIAFDPNRLVYVGSEAIPADWEMTFSCEDGLLKYLGLSAENRGLPADAPLMRITFRALKELAEGDEIILTPSDATAYDGQGELTLPGIPYTGAVARPLSPYCHLTSLSVKGGNLSPKFSPSVTEYTVTLPYTSMFAELTTSVCEYGEVRYGNRTLNVGENTVTVTVIAETGHQRVYTITVIRAADPNYVPSSDNRILSLDVGGALLFPAFSPEITEYSVYLVKGLDVTLTPTPADKAEADPLTIIAKQAAGSTAEDATAGTYTIVCAAEDGSTRTYVFKTILLDTPEELSTLRANSKHQESSPLLTLLIFGVVALLLFITGFVVSRLFQTFSRRMSARK